MPEPIRYDTPGLRYGSGLRYGGTIESQPNPKPKTMNTKASIDFSDYSAAELSPLAHTIHDKMLANVATFAAPPITMAAFQTQVASYDAKLIARASGAKSDTVAFNAARALLETTLGALGNYVNAIALGDATAVDHSGFPSYTTGGSPDLSAPAAPADLRLRHGDVSGSLVARYKPARPVSTNEVQTTNADPNGEANWHPAGMFQGGRADLDGFTPGAVVWVRVRTVGLKGVMGDWCDPAHLRVM